jgi:phospholipase/carboxylesterase
MASPSARPARFGLFITPRSRSTRRMLQTEFIPAVEKDSKRLLIALHGLGDSAAGYRGIPYELRLPSLNYLLANAPDPYFGGYSWYAFSGDEAAGILRSRKLLFELLDTTRAKGFASEDTVLFGFSQGCLMTADVGFRYPHRLAGLVGISGYVHNPDQLITELSPVAAQQRMLFTHGTQDPLIPFAQVREQVNLLKAAGLHIDWHEFVKAHTIAGEEEFGLIRKFIEGRFKA